MREIKISKGGGRYRTVVAPGARRKRTCPKHLPLCGALREGIMPATNHTRIILAACETVERAMQRAGTADEMADMALKLARKWTDGKASVEDMQEAVRVIMDFCSSRPAVDLPAHIFTLAAAFVLSAASNAALAEAAERKAASGAAHAASVTRIAELATTDQGAALQALKTFCASL